MRIFAVICAVLGLVAAVYGAGVLLSFLGHAEARSQQSLGALDSLALETGSGDVDVRTGDGPARLELVEHRGVFGGPDVEVRRGDDGRVTVRSDCPWFAFGSCGVDVAVVVPAATAVTLSTGSGDVTAAGLRDVLDIETGSGQIDIDGASGPSVTLDTGSGSLSARSLDAQRVRAETGSGEVELVADSAPDDLVADTGSGDVLLTLPDVGFAFAIETGSGEESIGVRQDPAAPRRVTVDTGSGDVTVRPAG